MRSEHRRIWNPAAVPSDAALMTGPVPWSPDSGPPGPLIGIPSRSRSLCCLSSEIPADERLITVEDSLSTAVPNRRMLASLSETPVVPRPVDGHGQQVLTGGEGVRDETLDGTQHLCFAEPLKSPTEVADEGDTSERSFGDDWRSRVSLLIRGEHDARWRAPEVTSFQDEALLQRIIIESPSLLPGVPEAGVLAVAEVDYIDVLCLDLDGGITLCECKLHTNPEIKRKIVGQLVAYAAALWKMPYDQFDRRVTGRGGKEVITRMQQLADDAGASDWSSETFRASVTANLREGQFRLVFAVDKITGELKRIVEFMNAHTSAGLQVLAVEIGYVKDSGVEILDPTAYGSELVPDNGGTGRPVWDRPSFVAALRARSPEAAPGIEAVMAWAEQGRADEVYGRGNDGSWYPVWNGSGMKKAPISGWTSGSICVNMHNFRAEGLEDAEEATFKSELARRCDEAGVALSPAKDAPAIGPPLADDEGLERFLSVLGWVRAQFDAASGGSGPTAI